MGITFLGNPVTPEGKQLKVGEQALQFTVVVTHEPNYEAAFEAI